MSAITAEWLDEWESGLGEALWDDLNDVRYNDALSDQELILERYMGQLRDRLDGLAAAAVREEGLRLKTLDGQAWNAVTGQRLINRADEIEGGM